MRSCFGLTDFPKRRFFFRAWRQMQCFLSFYFPELFQPILERSRLAVSHHFLQPNSHMLCAGIFGFEAGKNKQSLLAALGNFSGMAQAAQIAPLGPLLQFCLQRKRGGDKSHDQHDHARGNDSEQQLRHLSRISTRPKKARPAVRLGLECIGRWPCRPRG